MSYLLSQIWICLLLTALIAGLAGWFLRGSSKGKIKAIEEEWKIKLARAQNERDYYAGEVKSFSAVSQERDELEQNYLLEKEQMGRQLEEMQMGASVAAEKIKENEILLQLRAQELDDANTQIIAKKEEDYDGFTQQLAETESNVKQAEDSLKHSEIKVSELQSELDETKVKLLDVTNKLSDTESHVSEAEERLSAAESKFDNRVIEDDLTSEYIPDTDTRSTLLSTPDSTEVADKAVDTFDNKSSKDGITGVIAEKLSKAKDRTVEAGSSVVSSTKGSTSSEESSNTDYVDTRDNQVNIDDHHDSGKSKIAVAAAGAGAGALGFAGIVADKFNHAKDELFDRVDPDSESYDIRDVHTINVDESKRLSQMNIENTDELIEKCSNKEGIQLVAKSMGKENWVVRSWASIADLMRVKGVESINAELLELAGISSVQALASAKLDKLTDSVKVIHKHVGKTSHRPDADEVGSWIKRAADLPKMLDDNLDKL